VSVASPGPRRSALDRALAAYPLLIAYLVLLVLYAWETTRHSTPWLFTDELEWAGLSRGVAHHGVPELRLHHAHFTSIYEYMIAPSWWLGATSKAYAAIKYENAAVMTAALFPAYALARLFVTRTASIACGVAAVAIPAVFYTGLIIPEALAYFWSTLALWLLARALLAPSRRSVALAAGAALIAPFVRSELSVLLAAGVLAASLSVATSGRGRRVIGSWSKRERAGALMLLVGFAILLGAFMTQHSYSWQIGTHFHHRAFTYGLWAFGAFTIGVGVAPVFLTLVWLVGARFREADERALAATIVGAVVGFGLYTAVKASYLSTNFAIRVEERNLIYLSPLVFVTSARWLLAGRARAIAVVASAGAVAYLLYSTPYHNNEHFYSDAPGLSVLQWLNRTWYFTTADAHRLMYAILACSILIVVVWDWSQSRGGRLRRGHAAVGAILAVAIVGWNLTGEITAADSSNSFSKSFRSVLPTPPSWIDQETGRGRTMFIGQALGNSNAFWSLEFWNQSIGDVWSVDASAPGPGPSTTPNFLDLTGAVDPQLPLNWIVAGPGVDPVGHLTETVGGLRLYRVPHPIRLAAAQGNVSPDGWMATNAWYYRFASPKSGRGTAVVRLTRAAACGAIPPSRITIRVSRLRLNGDSQPVAGQLLALRRVLLRSTPCDTRAVQIPVRPPFRIDVTAVGTFQPSASDLRQLSAQIAFEFVPDRR
jgi:hypothetical protein